MYYSIIYYLHIFMHQILLPISERGQITIPKKIRAALKSQFVSCSIKDDIITLQAVQTKEDFLQELDDAHEDWKVSGGKSLADMKNDYAL